MRFIALAAAGSVIVGSCRTAGSEVAVDEGRTQRAKVTARVVDEIPEPPSREVILQGPVFTPFTEAPSLLNPEEVVVAVQREYPDHLREAGVGGSVRVYLLLDDEGQVLRRVIDETSGNEELDAAALRAARAYLFSPARNRGQPVYVWISVPITFAAR